MFALFGFLFVPLTWVLVALVFAIRAPTLPACRRWLGVAVGLLLLLTCSPLNGVAWYYWEIPRVPVASLGHYDAAIILSGITKPAPPEHDRIAIKNGSDRLLHPLMLWRQGYIRRFIVSGGSGGRRLQPGTLTEAGTMREVLLNCGVPDSLITLEERSRDTHENAIFTAELLRLRPALAPRGRLLLVTSAYHMRRAVGCFRRAGLTVTPFSTDAFGAPLSWSLGQFMPNADAMAGWQLFLHETLGYLTYHLKGYC